MSLKCNTGLSYLFLQTLLGADQNIHEAFRWWYEILFDSLRLGAICNPPTMIHGPHGGDEDFSEQLLHTF